MLDAELFGLRAGWHHMVSVALHAANVLLLFALLRRMTGSIARSTAVAAFFAVHPLHVESVAWIAERKDVLSTLFWLLTMWMYVSYVRRPGWLRYTGTLAVFAIGLMAKPMLVTLPLVLLLADWWPLNRYDGYDRYDRYDRYRRFLVLLREKLPMVALVVASSVITLVVQRQGGAVASLDLLPLSVRVSNAFVSYFTYLGKTFWPVDLAAFYPYNRSLTLGLGAVALLGIVALSVAAWRASRTRPYAGVGWFWFIGTLVPVIGVVQVGTQAVADRYTYVPHIGLFILIVWGVSDLLARLPARRVVLAATAVALVVASSVVARAQVDTWQNGRTLWEHALVATDRNYLAHTMLAGLLGQEGRHQDALAHLRLAVQFDPAYPEAHLNLGVSLAALGQHADAMAAFQRALRLQPTLAGAHVGLGFALVNLDRHAEAQPSFERALQLDATLVDAHRGLGLVLARQGRTADAERHYAEAVRLDPDAASAQRKLGKARMDEGKAAEAIALYREALRLRPEFPEAHSDLGFALMASGRRQEALAHFTEAIRLRPDFVEPRLHLGFMLAAEGRFEDALVHFTEAVRLAPDSETAHGYRAIALHNLGRIDEARQEFEAVLRLDPSNEGAKRGLAAIAARQRAGSGGGR
jgi:tetratricopeptide (TPR) repeat protein